jgi:hypothetical protein
MKKKFPRIPHCPWSEGQTSDDKTLKNCNHLVGKRVVASLKMDGENFSLAREYCHARSLDSRDHVSRSWIKQLHGRIKSEIPEGWIIAGENLFAKHSIKYNDLKSYFYVFGIWEGDKYLAWDDVQEFSKILGLETVEEIWRGTWDESAIRNISIDKSTQEGYVIRNEQSFMRESFGQNVCKYVRANHVCTDSHWMFTATEKNELK